MLNFSLKKLNRSILTLSLAATLLFAFLFTVAEPLFLSARESQLTISLTVIEEISSAQNKEALSKIGKRVPVPTEGEISLVLTGY